MLTIKYQKGMGYGRISWGRQVRVLIVATSYDFRTFAQGTGELKDYAQEICFVSSSGLVFCFFHNHATVQDESPSCDVDHEPASGLRGERLGMKVSCRRRQY